MVPDESVKSEFAHIPERIGGLVDLAYNLWWSWHPEARVLFKQINQQAWKGSLHNPVLMLRDIPLEYLQRAAQSPEYLHRYDIIMHRFETYLKSRTGWFKELYNETRPLTIAYFSAEYGLHHSLPFYAGGLGFLAGDHLKECSDLGVPMVAVGFMYSEGYLHQHVRADGWQDNVTESLERDAAPIVRVPGAGGEQLVIQVPFIEPPIYTAVWKVQVGKIPLYLLDTDIDRNTPENRSISSRLYASDRDLRLRQELVLGIGGSHVLHTLGIDFSAIHLNEGHPAFAILERIRQHVDLGVPFTDAFEQVRGTTVFTTHTPVPAGTDIFPESLMDRYFGHYVPTLGIDRSTFMRLGTHPFDPSAGFNMTAFALRGSGFHNAVSRRHAEIAREMWKSLWPDRSPGDIPIDYITNGVHVPTWLDPRMEILFNKYLFPVIPHWQQEHDNQAIWELVDEIPDRELWETHVWLKSKLLNRIRERKRLKYADLQDEPINLVAEGLLLNPSVLTIGFARRFSTYKRADLIFHDPERLKKILNNPLCPVQILFAGKAHFADDEGKRILQRIYRAAQSPEYGGRIGFIEDYGEQVAQYLVHGVDVWLNNPIPPLEASGTSGMKAALNGVINLSILDGWWLEGYNGKNGWAFGSNVPPGDRTAGDAATLYDILEHQVIPLYYDLDLDGIPHGWVSMMKESIKSNAPRFSARRMVKEYVTMYYPSLLKCAISGQIPCKKAE